MFSYKLLLAATSLLLKSNRVWFSGSCFDLAEILNFIRFFDLV